VSTRAEARERLGDRLERALEERADVDARIAEGEALPPPPPRAILRKVVWLVITGVSLYLVAPALMESVSSWEDIKRVSPAWLAAMAVLQAAVLVCLWWLQVIALHTRDWYAVATSQLASNGVAKVAPGGGAVGAALQYRMLVQAGIQRAKAVAGLTASNLLMLAVVLALPVLAIPALIRGGVDRSLAEAAIAGLAVFAVLFALGACMLALDGPLRWVGRTIQTLRNRLRRRSEPLTGLPTRLVRERDRILETVGPRWKAALTAGIGRWAFDYGMLVAALAAVGSTPRPALVLLAYCGSQLLAQIPLTPGGLGFVEAGLAASLTLAGVAPGDAVLATFAYRLFTFWLPMQLGVLGALLHRRRFDGSVQAPAA
jgi:uncharacterized protein (TIRG00374 family)